MHREAEHRGIVTKGNHHMQEHLDKVNPVGQDKQDCELGMVGSKVVLGKQLWSAVSDRNLRWVACDSHTIHIDLHSSLYLEVGVGRCRGRLQRS